MRLLPLTYNILFNSKRKQIDWNTKFNCQCKSQKYNWGRKVLDVVIGIAEYHYKYVKVLVIDLDNKFTIFSTIAEAQLQIANSAFASGFKNKLKSFMRTNPDIH